jgi:hypothetical protein
MVTIWIGVQSANRKKKKRENTVPGGPFMVAFQEKKLSPSGKAVTPVAPPIWMSVSNIQRGRILTRKIW